MNWNTIQSLIQSWIDRALATKALLMYSAVIVTGLGLARFTYSATFSIIDDPAQAAKMTPTGAAQSARAQNRAKVDPQSLIGGSLFADVLTITKFEAEAPPEEMQNFILLGTLEGHWSFARAVIQIIGSNEPAKEYAIGQKIGIAKIIDIGREKIWVRINGEKRVIKVGESTQNPPGGEAKTVDEGDVTVITRVLLRQEVISKLKGNMEDIYRNAKWGPVFVDGKIGGFKLHRLGSNHIFFALGARSGDVVQSVNGFPLSNTERMLELWNNVPSMNRIQILIERGGKMFKYDFHIRD